MRRTVLFAVALAAGFALVPLVAPGVHEPGDFVRAAELTVIMVLTVVVLPWRRLPTWVEIVPPLLYMVVVAELYAQGGGATSGFGVLILLPVLWLALYGSQAQMVASIISAAVVVVGPQLLFGGAVDTADEYRRGFVVAIVATVMGFTVQRLVVLIRDRAKRESERAGEFEEVTHQFDRAFETAPIGMAIATVTGRFMRVNPSLCSMVGRAREDLVGCKLEEITHPDDRAVDRDAIPKLLSGKISTYQAEKRYLHIDGEIVWVLLSVTLVRDSQGAPRHLFAQMQDVTARRLAEQRMSESEKRFRAVGTQAPVGIFETDAQWKCTFVNQRWSEITGISEQQAIGDGWHGVVHPDDRERVAKEWADATGVGAAFDSEFRMQTPEGRVSWVSATAIALRDETRAITGYLGTTTDITERRRVERLDGIQSAVSKAMADSTGYEDAIQRMIAALGLSMGWQLGVFWEAETEYVATGSIGRPVSVLRCLQTWHTPDIDAERFVERCRQMTFSSPLGMLGRVWEGGTGEWSASLGSARSQRSQLAVAVGMNGSVCLPVYGDERLLGVLEFFGTDVEDPGEAFLDTRSGIGRQVGEYIERKRAEGEADRAKDEFFALVSHELRTPLTSIIGYLELMQEEDAGMEPDEKRHFLGIVHRNADRLLRLVGDLLLVAQVQAGRFALSPGPVDLNSIAAQAVEAAEPIAAGRTIALVLKAEPVPTFEGDRDRIAQLFDNLISNALKFTDPGERVTVKVGTRGEQALVEVTNSGSLIPERERSRLFDRFFRASDATTRLAPGVGLGLAIVKAIVEAHAGNIKVESSSERGTTFRFTLPLRQASGLVALEDGRRAA